jgi:hypothetical protein
MFDIMVPLSYMIEKLAEARAYSLQAVADVSTVGSAGGAGTGAGAGGRVKGEGGSAGSAGVRATQASELRVGSVDLGPLLASSAHPGGAERGGAEAVRRWRGW